MIGKVSFKHAAGTVARQQAKSLDEKLREQRSRRKGSSALAARSSAQGTRAPPHAHAHAHAHARCHTRSCTLGCRPDGGRRRHLLSVALRLLSLSLVSASVSVSVPLPHPPLTHLPFSRRVQTRWVLKN